MYVLICMRLARCHFGSSACSLVFFFFHYLSVGTTCGYHGEVGGERPGRWLFLKTSLRPSLWLAKTSLRPGSACKDLSEARPPACKDLSEAQLAGRFLNLIL